MELPVVGLDVVEVAPPYDHAEVTAFLATGWCWKRCPESPGGAAVPPGGPISQPATHGGRCWRTAADLPIRGEPGSWVTRKLLASNDYGPLTGRRRVFRNRAESAPQ